MNAAYIYCLKTRGERVVSLFCEINITRIIQKRGCCDTPSYHFADWCVFFMPEQPCYPQSR